VVLAAAALIGQLLHLIADEHRRRLESAPSASASASASPSIVSATTIWLQALTIWPLPAAPTPEPRGGRPGPSSAPALRASRRWRLGTADPFVRADEMDHRS